VSNSLRLHGLKPASVLLCPWGFSRQEYWSGLQVPSPGDLPDPGFKPGSPALQADSLPSEPQGSPYENTVDQFHQILARTSSPPSPLPHMHTFWPLHSVCKWTRSRCSADTWKLCFLGFRAPLHLSRHLTLTTPHLSPSGSCLSQGNSKGFPTSVCGGGNNSWSSSFLGPCPVLCSPPTRPPCLQVRKTRILGGFV